MNSVPGAKRTADFNPGRRTWLREVWDVTASGLEDCRRSRVSLGHAYRGHCAGRWSRGRRGGRRVAFAVVQQMQHEMATAGGWNLVQLANPSPLNIEVMVLTGAPLAVPCTVHPNTVWTLQAQGAIQSVAVRLEGACAEKRAIHGGAGGGKKRQQTAPYPPRSRSWSSWSERMDLASDAMPP